MNNQDYLDELDALDETEAPITPLDITKHKDTQTDTVADTDQDKPKKAKKAKKAKKEKGEPNLIRIQMTSIFFWFLAFLTIVFFVANIWENAGPLIEGYVTFLYGLFGWGGLFTVCLFMLYGIEWRRYVTEKTVLFRVILSICMLMVLSAFFHVIMIMVKKIPEPAFVDAFHFGEHWYTDRTVVGGGAIGGLIGSICYVLMHGWVSLLILALAFAFADRQHQPQRDPCLSLQQRWLHRVVLQA